ncbi:protein kinase domain-containing protein [Sorangium sp. So ce1024]|uniref:serine/threonine-protein kinase n=1 Tax=Sorangium sp. So ce1024 TaxID=3133327 RepID=UPI003F0CA115
MGREALKAGDVFLDYRITEVIDAGGMGEVYKAVEDYSEDVVAIKCMSPRHLRREDFARRFRQECKFYPKLKHPNIVRMRKAGVSPEDVAYIVMDYLEGRTLRKVLNKIYRLDFLSAMHVMLQVADAMTFVHSKGIWHRDLKPENIMVGAKEDAKGHVWLLDFGIAKFADGGMNTDDLPDVGTVRYISPEQVKMLYGTSAKAERGERARPDGRTDIYAFGAIFYEVLTGKHLFLNDSEPATAEETLTGHLVAAPEPVHELVPDCPEFVWPVVARCIAIDREERYPRFDDVARDLRSLLRDTVPAGHVLARRLAQERMKAERQAAFAGVELEDSAPVEGEQGKSKEARGEGGGVERGSEARVETRARRVVHGETAPLEQFVAPASPLPFTPALQGATAGRVLRGVGYTEPLPSTLPPLRVGGNAGGRGNGTSREATARLGGAWAERMASGGAAPAAGEAVSGPPVAQAYAGPPAVAGVRAEAYAGPVPMAQAYAGPAPGAQVAAWTGAMPEARAQAVAGPPPEVAVPYATPPLALMETQRSASAPLPVAGLPPMPSGMTAPGAQPAPLPVAGLAPVPSGMTAPGAQPAPLPVAGLAPVPSGMTAPGAQPAPLPVAGLAPVPSGMTAPGAQPAPLPVAGLAPVPSGMTAPGAQPAGAMWKETPATPAVMSVQPRRAMRVYVLAPLVALGITVAGVGAALGIRAMRGGAPDRATGEPAVSAEPIVSAPASVAPANIEPAMAPAAEATAPAAEATAPAAEASAAAPASAATAVSTAEAAAEAGAAAQAEAVADAKAPASKEPPPKEQPRAKAAPRKAPAEAADEDDIYPMPKRQKPSFVRVLSEQREQRKKASPGPTAAPVNAGSAKPAGPCVAAGCRPF